MRILIATMNEGKLREYARLLADVPGLELETMASLAEPVEVVEDRYTFRGNALKKATEIAKHAGMPCLADDSGLEVDALGGRPGVYSARYAGQGATDAQNNVKLLGELSGISDEQRSARFRCAIVVVDAKGPSARDAADGACEGRIGRARKAPTASATTPCSFPRATRRRWRSWGPKPKTKSATAL